MIRTEWVSAAAQILDAEELGVDRYYLNLAAEALWPLVEIAIDEARS